MSHPYDDLPAAAFWSRSVARLPQDQIDPVAKSKFRIQASDKVATAGSCFAQRITQHLRELGVPPMVTEPGHPHLRKHAPHFHYGLYTARYGNIYSARQMLQLFERAFDTFSPKEAPWRQGDIWVDPFRPLIPGGFASLQEYERDRAQHLAAVRTMFEEMDVLIFTLGLTETWRSKADGAVFPSCPGTIAGTWDAAAYEFVNSDIFEVVSDLQALWAKIQAINPAARMILTVSPVPLVATARDEHVLVANTYSKSVLRVAAEMVADQSEAIAYFPSYELITGPQTRGAAFKDDFRKINKAAVGLVMEMFSRHYLVGAATTAAPIPVEAPSEADRTKALIDAVCEELYNDRAAL